MSSFKPTIHPWNQEIWQNLTLEPERSNHALLFCGDSGLGKQDLAFSLAHFILTSTHAQSESLFSAGSHPDMHIIMPECEIQAGLLGDFARRYIEPHSGKPKKTITIDQIRKLSQALTTHPHIGAHRVILILFSETMNRNAVQRADRADGRCGFLSARDTLGTGIRDTRADYLVCDDAWTQRDGIISGATPTRRWVEKTSLRRDAFRISSSAVGRVGGRH